MTVSSTKNLETAGTAVLPYPFARRLRHRLPRLPAQQVLFDSIGADRLDVNGICQSKCHWPAPLANKVRRSCAISHSRGRPRGGLSSGPLTSLRTPLDGPYAAMPGSLARDWSSCAPIR
jgi:hypothetical protein